MRSERTTGVISNKRCEKNKNTVRQGDRENRFSFRKTDKLRKRSEYVYVSSNGTRVANRHFIAFFVKRRSPGPRIGITATKRVGTAVVRNRIKRQCREFFRLNRGRLRHCVDINLIVKKEAAGMSSQAAWRSLTRLFEDINRKSEP